MTCQWFNFGRSYGDVRGVIGALDIPLHFVSPQKWKKHLAFRPTKSSRAFAIRCFRPRRAFQAQEA
jgi:hypothetical protein